MFSGINRLMHWRLVTFLMLTTSLAGCKTTDTPRPVQTEDRGRHMTAVTLSLTGEVPAIDERPFRFWMYRSVTDREPVLATNRSARTLRYVAANYGIDVPVTPEAIRCMGSVFAAIEQANLKQTQVWQEFRKLWPYRFLEILPEVHDFRSYQQESADPAAPVKAGFMTRPTLWSGLAAADAPAPGESGFRVRGYLKWKGVLLPDGVTCMISQSDDLTRLLADAVDCERGNNANCSFATGDDQ
jgi:hypothetical protein